MKPSSPLAIVVLSLPLMSCVSDPVLTTPGSAVDAGARVSAVSAPLADLMAVHHDYLAQVRNTVPGSPYSCN